MQELILSSPISVNTSQGLPATILRVDVDSAECLIGTVLADGNNYDTLWDLYGVAKGNDGGFNINCQDPALSELITFLATNCED